ncbi:hypothetical protein RHSIM_Rhsim05G0077200 [Rhododendron simsii]|uniref:Uncharacterized protein n=1 Tax=Rhododendron simsii TaxID=118357 RepID=A0A834GX50_RHOSS|nr:hypothetical protein RHSIM_Rhsim05G0077200 [Rhododendron simsii]
MRNFVFSAVYSETEVAGGSSEWVFQLEGQTTQSTAYPNRNALVFPQPHIALEEVLNENGGSSEDRRDSLASQAEASFEGHVSESSNLTGLACSDAAAPNQPLATMPSVPDIIPHPTGGSSHLTGGSSEFSGCPNLSGIVDPHPQIASTQIPRFLSYRLMLVPKPNFYYGLHRFQMKLDSE